jgi:hypothetical protein
MTSTYRRWGGLAVLAAAAVGLAGCGGGSSAPHVASLGKSSSGASGSASGTGNVGRAASSLPKGSPTQLLDEWASCMRRHGVPGQADPTVTASKVIDVTWNPATPGGLFGTSEQSGPGPGRFCSQYLYAAQKDLGGGAQGKPPSLATTVKYAECMRANGVPTFPDPSSGVFHFGTGNGVNPASPAFQHASQLCGKRYGMQDLDVGANIPGSIDFNGQPGL